jgi:hypothetical protein
MLDHEEQKIWLAAHRSLTGGAGSVGLSGTVISSLAVMRRVGVRQIPDLTTYFCPLPGPAAAAGCRRTMRRSESVR